MKRRADCLAVEARVVDVAAGGYIEIELDSASRCAGCAGLCAWRRGGGRTRFRAAGRFERGAAVRVTLPAGRVLSGALLLHGVPLAALLAGAAAGAAVAQSDLGTLLGALAGVVLAVPASKGLLRRAEAATIRSARVETVGRREPRALTDNGDAARRARSTPDDAMV